MAVNVDDPYPRGVEGWVTATPAVAALLLAGACAGSGCGRDAGGAGTAPGDEVVIDGSSTVAPLTIAAVERTDLSDASRRIRDAERSVCVSGGVQFVELQVAADALTVVTGKGTTFLTCLTAVELKRLWESSAEGRFEEHQITALIGPSGCGKSTVLKCLNRMTELVPGSRGR